MEGTHRPLLAADIALDDSWMVPSRVALIGCSSGGDAAYVDPTGLAVAFTIRGAQYVTAARWILPTDTRLATLALPPPAPAPGDNGTLQNLTRAVVAVNAAHEATDPVAALCTWQRAQADA
ncbi:hypothetical protein [Promicromonospora sp. NPDC057488]|uniref:hypothetical protein n=1 Tax=Promicromonospora sp. NPDC057488 TaxID=3346147 RepID=UPI00366D4616